MINRIKDKVNKINKYLEELGQIKPKSFEEYEESIKDKAACERYFEKIIEAVVDLGFLMIKYKELSSPEDDKQMFDVLLENKIISKNTKKKMKSAKGMKNMLGHQYGKVDDEIVFESITDEIEKDVNEFIKEISKSLET